MFIATSRSNYPSSLGAKCDLLDISLLGAYSIILRPLGYKYFVPTGLMTRGQTNNSGSGLRFLLFVLESRIQQLNLITQTQILPTQ